MMKSFLVNDRTWLRASVALPLAAVAVLAAGGVSAASAKGSSYEVLYNFDVNTGDGADIYANLMKDKSGNFYGTAGGGGACFHGTVYKITPSGTETVLYSFQGGTNDGADPVHGTLLEDAAGNLYGTTSYGDGTGCDSEGCGMVFKLAQDGTETILHTFGGTGDGASPVGGVIADRKGNLYGTTSQGGNTTNCSAGCGTVYKIAPDGTETVLYSFAGGTTDGAYPDNSLIMVGGNLYGVTTTGGPNNNGVGNGIVFELVKGKKGAWTEQILHTFTGTDGSYPTSDLTADSAGNLYGTAETGGAYGYGDVFELAPNGTFTVLYSFQGSSDGEAPRSAVRLAKNGDLYGMTAGNLRAGVEGTVFQLTPDGTETVLHTFTGSPNDGLYPQGGGPLTEAGGYLYGSTYEGGTNNNGVVFRIKE